MNYIKTGNYPDYSSFHGNRREEMSMDWMGKMTLENVDEKSQLYGQSYLAKLDNSVSKGPNYNDYIYKCDICHGLLRRELIYEHAEKHRIELNRQAQFQFQNHQIPKEDVEEDEQNEQEIETKTPKPLLTLTEPWSQNSSIPNFNYNRWANSGYNYNYMSRFPPHIPTQAQTHVQVAHPSDSRIQREYPQSSSSSTFIQEKHPERVMNEKRLEMNSYSAEQLIVISHWNRMNQLHQTNNSQPLDFPVNLNITDSRQQLRQFLQSNKKRARELQIHRSNGISDPSPKDLTTTTTPQVKRLKTACEEKQVGRKEIPNPTVTTSKLKSKENGKLEPKSKSMSETRKFSHDDDSTPNSDSDSDSEYSVSSLLAQNCLPPLPELDDFKPFSCHLCPDEFYSKLGINTHLSVHHRIRI